MAILNNWDVNSNFWIVNPQFAVADDCRKLMVEDKSKNKEESSKIMWCIAYIYDDDSIYSNWEIKDRTKFAETEILKKTGVLADKKYKPIIDFYNSLQDTSAKRQLREWSRILDEKTELLRSLKYNINNWETIEKMLLNNSKLYGELDRILLELSKEGKSDRIKGGGEESLSEKGELDAD